jgi:hypothetical protein
MMQLSRPVSNSTAALLKINGLNLLLPQGEIRTLESATELNTIAPALCSAGWIAYHQKSWPVYCLSEDLSLLQAVPPERRACAMMTMGAGFIGILCDDMIILKDFIAQRHELPQAMKLPATPILHLVNYEQGIACVSNAKQMTAYIEHLVLNTEEQGKVRDGGE